MPNINIDGRQFLFYARDFKVFYKFTDDFGKTYSAEHEVQQCSVDYSVSMIEPEGYVLIRIKKQRRLGIPFHDGTILWHSLSKQELKLLEKLL